MLKRLGPYRYLIIAVILALVLLGLSGYFFASQQSEPVYLSKIDQLMYDRNNQSPKYILTLPDYKPQKKVSQAELPLAEESENRPEPMKQTSKEKTLQDILSQVPNLQSLPDSAATQQLKYITLNEDLTEGKNNLMLPKIDKYGRKPWSEYGKAVETAPTFYKVAIVIKGQGFDPAATEKLNKALPSEVSISYNPYATEIGTKILSSRQYGHETYVDLLLSSKDFLKSDSGPLSMSLTINQQEAVARLHKTLSTGAPVGGVVINEGVADEDNYELLQRLLMELKKLGMLMIDATHGNGIEQIEVKGLARAKADYVIEYMYNREKLKEILQQAENTALRKGQVLLVIEPKPVIVDEVYKWIKTFSPQATTYEDAKTATPEKPLALVPVSNLVVE